MTDDLIKPTRVVRDYLGVDPAGLRMDRILEHCSFGYMRARAAQMAPFAGTHMQDPKAFFHKGPARDYRAEITPEQAARFDRLAPERLGEDCARWLETGAEAASAPAGGERSRRPAAHGSAQQRKPVE